VRAAKDAPRDPCSLLECRHSLAEIVERGAVVFVERLRVSPRSRSPARTRAAPPLAAAAREYK